MSTAARTASNAKRRNRSLGEADIGLEARVQGEDNLDTRIWLRMLACSAQIQHQMRQRLRSGFGTTLPRFDYMAQLERHAEGLRMNLLSRYLMVTGGSVTGLTDQLVKEGLVARIDDPDDRRSWRVCLTEQGRAEFERMAAEHQSWLVELFKGMPAAGKNALYEQLGQLRMHLAEEQNDKGDKGITKPAKKAASRTKARHD